MKCMVGFTKVLPDPFWKGSLADDGRFRDEVALKIEQDIMCLVVNLERRLVALGLFGPTDLGLQVWVQLSKDDL